jgi:DNA primase large subunit
MNISQIKTRIERIEKKLFCHSLERVAIEELEELQEEAIGLKESFLEISFRDIEREELEGVRFKLQEVSLGISINIKEKLLCDSSEDIRKLESLQNRTFLNNSFRERIYN